MGLFDTITIDHDLVPKKYRGVGFQTKDLYKAMEEYMVRPNGKLYRKDVKMGFSVCGESPFGFSATILSEKWLRKTDLDTTIEIHTSVPKKMELVVLHITFKKGTICGCRRKYAPRKYGRKEDL